MSTAQSQMIYTPADLLAMPDGKNFELVQGNLVEKPMSVLSSIVEVNVSTLLKVFSRTQKAGEVLGSTNGIRCFPDDPNKVRKPDVSFIKSERFSIEHLLEGFLTIAPDLVVEVISLRDLAGELDWKVEEYLAAGVPLVWVIDPEAQLVIIHRHDGSVTKLRRNDELTGENILPGFKCKVADLFPEMKRG
jgi:Uma2 family endonuclease